jgi:hypothetical protein
VSPWDYEGYWGVVLGANRDAAMVVRDFDLAPSDLDKWLGEAEVEAWRMGGEGKEMPEEWARHHQTALEELSAAVYVEVQS